MEKCLCPGCPFTFERGDNELKAFSNGQRTYAIWYLIREKLVPSQCKLEARKDCSDCWIRKEITVAPPINDR